MILAEVIDKLQQIDPTLYDGEIEVCVRKCPCCGDAEYQTAKVSLTEVDQFGELAVVFE